MRTNRGCPGWRGQVKVVRLAKAVRSDQGDTGEPGQRESGWAVWSTRGHALNSKRHKTVRPGWHGAVLAKRSALARPGIGLNLFTIQSRVMLQRKNISIYRENHHENRGPFDLMKTNGRPQSRNYRGPRSHNPANFVCPILIYISRRCHVSPHDSESAI